MGIRYWSAVFSVDGNSGTALVYGKFAKHFGKQCQPWK